MKNVALALFIIAIVVAIGSFFIVNQNQPLIINTNSTNNSNNSLNIIIQGFAFSPNELTINSGETVTWKNLDSATHKLMFNDFNSENMEQNNIYSHKFTSKGNYSYYCSIHPSMKGKIIVK